MNLKTLVHNRKDTKAQRKQVHKISLIFTCLMTRQNQIMLCFCDLSGFLCAFAPLRFKCFFLV